MTIAWHFTNNQFLSVTEGTYRKTLILGNDHQARLLAEADNEPPNIPGLPLPTILKLSDRFVPVMDEYRTRHIDWLAAKANYRHETQVMDELFDDVRGNKIPRWEALVIVEFPKGSAEFTNIFPQGRKPFRHTKRDETISYIGTIAANLQDYPVLVDVMNDVEAFYNQILQQRNTQQILEDEVRIKSSSLEQQRILLCEEMYLNLSILMAKYYTDPEQVERFFDLSLIRESITDEEDEAKAKTQGGPLNVGVKLTKDAVINIGHGDGTSQEMTGDGINTNFYDKIYNLVKLYIILITGAISEIIELHINNSNLTYFKLHKSMKNLRELILQNNQLTTKIVDNILVDMNKFNTSGPGVINLIGNEPPSAKGLAAKAELESRGWMVLVS